MKSISRKVVFTVALPFVHMIQSNDYKSYELFVGSRYCYSWLNCSVWSKSSKREIRGNINSVIFIMNWPVIDQVAAVMSQLNINFLVSMFVCLIWDGAEVVAIWQWRGEGKRGRPKLEVAKEWPGQIVITSLGRNWWSVSPATLFSTHNILTISKLLWIVWKG